MDVKDSFPKKCHDVLKIQNYEYIKYQERLNYYVNLNLFYTSLMVEINK